MKIIGKDHVRALVQTSEDKARVWHIEEKKWLCEEKHIQTFYKFGWWDDKISPEENSEILETINSKSNRRSRSSSTNSE